jgi:hypothetical protein
VLDDDVLEHHMNDDAETFVWSGMTADDLLALPPAVGRSEVRRLRAWCVEPQPPRVVRATPVERVRRLRVRDEGDPMKATR